MSAKELALATPSSLMPSQQEWALMMEQATTLGRSGLLPKSIDTPEKAIAIALKGRELGIPMMHSFSHIHIVDGKPGASAELMLALIYRKFPQAVVHYKESSEKICRVVVTRPGRKEQEFSYSIDEAQKAGLLAKTNWQKYAAAMLRARAVAIVGRAVFPDALMGCNYTPEELG